MRRLTRLGRAFSSGARRAPNFLSNARRMTRRCYTQAPSVRPLPSPLLHTEAVRLLNPVVLEPLVLSSHIADTVVSRKALTLSDSIIADAENARSSKTAFFDSDTHQCRLCNAQLEGSYRSHVNGVDHRYRMEVVRRTLAMLLTFAEQVEAEPPSIVRAPTTSSANSGGEGATATKLYCSSTADAEGYVAFRHPHSPLFDEEEVPVREVWHRRPRTFREIDLVDITFRRWWCCLNRPREGGGNVTYERLLSLTSREQHARRWRVRYLLYFLKSRGVLRSCLSIKQSDSNPCSGSPENMQRSPIFEKHEVIGDYVWKSLTPDRLRTLFPSNEGGVGGGLEILDRAIDSNHGLLEIYDYFNLDELTGCALCNSKSKADVVEAIVGELQTLLWSAEMERGTEKYASLGTRATQVYLRALVAHTLHELGHAVVMWRLDSALQNAKDFIKKAAEPYFTRSGKRSRPNQKGAKSLDNLAEMMPKYALMPWLLAWECGNPRIQSERDAANYAAGVVILTRAMRDLKGASSLSLHPLSRTSSSPPLAVDARESKQWTLQAQRVACQTLVSSLLGGGPAATTSVSGKLVRSPSLPSRKRNFQSVPKINLPDFHAIRKERAPSSAASSVVAQLLNTNRVVIYE